MSLHTGCVGRKDAVYVNDRTSSSQDKQGKLIIREPEPEFMSSILLKQSIWTQSVSHNGPDYVFLFTNLIFQPISLILTKALRSIPIHPFKSHKPWKAIFWPKKCNRQPKRARNLNIHGYHYYQLSRFITKIPCFIAQILIFWGPGWIANSVNYTEGSIFKFLKYDISAFTFANHPGSRYNPEY